MKKFQQYINLQKLVLQMEGEDQINNVLQLIIDNQLLKDEKHTFSTLHLIASAVFSNPSLLQNAIQLLSKFPSFIDISTRLQITGIEDKEMAVRTKFIYFLLSQSNHPIETNDFDLQCLINPLPHKIFLQKELTKFYCCINPKTNIKKSLKNHKHDLFSDNLDDDKILDIRNSLHSLNPIVQSIRNDDLESLKNILSESHFDYNQKLPKSLFEINPFFDNTNMAEYSAFFGSIKCFNYLKQFSRKIDYISYLKYAIAGGNIELIKQIKKELNGADLSDNIAILHTAILFMRNHLIYSIIHSFNIKIDSESYIKCIYSSNYEAFNILRTLDYSTSIHVMGYIGSLPFDIAAFEGSYFFFKLLAEDPETNIMEFNNYGKTVLHSAVRNYKIDIVIYIIKHGLIDPNDRGEFGRTSIDLANYYHHDEILKYLLGYRPHP